jgi:hypothetical protein
MYVLPSSYGGTGVVAYHQPGGPNVVAHPHYAAPSDGYKTVPHGYAHGAANFNAQQQPQWTGYEPLGYNGNTQNPHAYKV